MCVCVWNVGLPQCAFTCALTKMRIVQVKYIWGSIWLKVEGLLRIVPGVFFGSVQSITAETQVQSWVSLCGISCGWSGTETGFSLRISVFPVSGHSTNASFSLIHLSLLLTSSLSNTCTIIRNDTCVNWGRCSVLTPADAVPPTDYSWAVDIFVWL